MIPLDFTTIRREHAERLASSERRHRSSRHEAVRLRTWGRAWR